MQHKTALVTVGALLLVVAARAYECDDHVTYVTCKHGTEFENEAMAGTICDICPSFMNFYVNMFFSPQCRWFVDCAEEYLKYYKVLCPLDQVKDADLFVEDIRPRLEEIKRHRDNCVDEMALNFFRSLKSDDD